MEGRLWGWKAILGIVAAGLLVVMAGALAWQLLRMLDDAKQALVAPQGIGGVLPLAKQWLDRESAPQAPLVPDSGLAVRAASPTPSPTLALDPNLPPAIAELARAWADQQDIAIAEESAADIGLNLMPSPDARMVTERILVPEHGARLGNFGVTEVSPQETWVTVAEYMAVERLSIEPGPGGRSTGTRPFASSGNDTQVKSKED